MDNLELWLNIHLLSMVAVLIIFVARAYTLFVGTQFYDSQCFQPNRKGRVIFVALQHLGFTVLILTGLMLWSINHFKAEPWFYAKIVLCFVFISASIKTYKLDNTIQLIQRRIGLVVSAIAFAAIIFLVMSKPIFS